MRAGRGLLIGRDRAAALADIERSAHDTRGEALSRLVAAAGYRLCALPTTAHTVAEWADAIYQELRSARHRDEVAFRAFIGLNDDLIEAAPPLRVALCVAPPAPCGDPRATTPPLQRWSSTTCPPPACRYRAGSRSRRGR